MNEEEPAVTEEQLTDQELKERVYAVVVAAVEGRDADVDELLVTMLWDDLVSVVNGLACLCAAHMAGGLFPPDTTAMSMVADLLRERIARSAAERNGLTGDHG